MSKVAAFVRLDFLTLKPYSKSYLIMLALSVLMGITFKSIATLSSYFMMCLILSLSYPFSIGEMNKLDSLYATLSLNRRRVVAGRYIFAVCLELLIVLLVVVSSLVISAFGFMTFSFSEVVVCLCSASMFFALMLSIQYPIYFKLGYTKAKFIASMPFFIVVIGALMIYGMLKNTVISDKTFEDFLVMLTTSQIVIFALPLVGHLMIYLSYNLSCKLYENRDI